MRLMMDHTLSPAEKAGRLSAIYADKQSLEKEFIAENPSPFAWILENERLSDLYGELFVIYTAKEMPRDLFEEAIGHQPRLVSNSGMGSYYQYLSNYLYYFTDRERMAIFRDELLPSIEIPIEKERLRAFIEMYEKRLEGLPYEEEVYRRESSYFRRQYKEAVLLDVWATWCGPCIYDMEESATNIEELRKMGVEVVYVCTANGTTRDGWQKKVAELNLNTKHIYLNPKLSKSIMSYFDLKGYPSHVFLDKEGKYHPDLVHSIRHIDFEAVRGRL